MNALTEKEQELYNALILEIDPIYWVDVQGELKYFRSKVQQVLESCFLPEQYKSLSSLLHQVNGGKLEFVFTNWLDELVKLDLLLPEIAQGYKEHYNAQNS